VQIDLHWWKPSGATGIVSRTVSGLSNGAWKNVQSTVPNGFAFAVPSGTSAVSVCFVGTKSAGGCNDMVVDVDAVSLHGY
jgi:hypothetical protein